MPKDFTDITNDIDAFVSGDSTSSHDYTEQGLSPQDILRSPYFLADLREEYGSDLTDEELVETFFQKQVNQDLNTFSAVGSAYGAATADRKTRERHRRFGKVYAMQPYFFQEGGRGWGEGLTNIGKAIGTDPTNLIPGYVGAKGVTLAARAAAGAGKSAVKRGAINQAIKGGIAEAGISGAQEGIIDVAGQTRDVQLGLQDEYSLGRTLLATGAGTVLGAGLGAGIGAGFGAFRGAKGKADFDILLGAGIPKERLATMTPEIAEAKLQQIKDGTFTLDNEDLMAKLAVLHDQQRIQVNQEESSGVVSDEMQSLTDMRELFGQYQRVSDGGKSLDDVLSGDINARREEGTKIESAWARARRFVESGGARRRPC